jgi:hypothetical protein
LVDEVVDVEVEVVGVCGWMKKKDGSGRGEILSTPAVRRVIGS